MVRRFFSLGRGNRKAYYYSPVGWESISSLDLSHEAFEGGIPLPAFIIKVTD